MMNTEQTTAEERVFLSVVVPVYNAEKTLHGCIKSVLAQTFKDFELLLIDDGSQDASADICRQYASKDRRVRYIFRENGGSLSARVCGAEHARGEYICFLDADDCWSTRNAFMRLYEKSKACLSDVIQFGYMKKYNHLHRTVSTVRTQQYASREEFLKRDYPLLLCSSWDSSRLTTNVWNKLYRRMLFQNIPASETLDRVFWGDDLILNILLLEDCHSVLFIPDVLYMYRQFSGGTSRFSRTIMKDLDTIKRYQLQHLESYEGEDEERIRSVLFSEIACWFGSYVKWSLHEQGREATKRMIEESLQYTAFQQARAYFRQHDVDWTVIRLLQEGDVCAYMAYAEKVEKRSMKDRIRAALREIYYRI